MNTRRKGPRRLFRRRPPATVAEMMTWLPIDGGSTLVVCLRVDLVEHVPPGYQTADCYRCHSAVWINAEVVAASEAAGMTVMALCLECVKPAEAGSEVGRHG